MVSLTSLKRALRQNASWSQQRQLSDAQYSTGFETLMQTSEWTTYQEFVIPQLTLLLDSLLNSRSNISILEIGPGPKSVLGSLPRRLREKITKYTAYEPNHIFASKLKEFCCPGPGLEPLLCHLENLPSIYRTPFTLDIDGKSNLGVNVDDETQKYDVVLFCHSMYGMKPKHRYIERALQLLVDEPEGATVVVFHREGIDFGDLVCAQTACFPNGVVRIPDEDEEIDSLTPFIAGFTMLDPNVDEAVRHEWRNVCRTLAYSDTTRPYHLLFSSPQVMVTFTRHAASLSELISQVPLSTENWKIKHPQARLHRLVAIVSPTEIQHVQKIVQWALKHHLRLTVLGGSHSGHCLWPYTVAIDMSEFHRIHILEPLNESEDSDSTTSPLVTVESGCTIGDVIQQTMDKGLTVPLGARPSVGAGLWLQGGIGHLSRLHGLACDSIVGTVLVSVESGQLFCVGHVPDQHLPENVERPEDEDDLLWAIKGAGTNFGIVLSVTFRAHRARTYLTNIWIVPLTDETDAHVKFHGLSEIATKEVPSDSSVDVYLYWNRFRFHLGVRLLETATSSSDLDSFSPVVARLSTILGPVIASRMVVDAVGLFDTELYISCLHGGLSGGTTSSFKRCVFLKDIGRPAVVKILLAAIENRPSRRCYLYFLQGGGRIAEVAAEDTAFGCRDWDFACVITGAWARDANDSDGVARAAEKWTYGVAADLSPYSCGVYCADLGPYPRDTALAARCFGPNRRRLTHLKQRHDPHDVLAYACPIPGAPRVPRLIILVTGESCAGKDYVAEIWAAAFERKHIAARAVSISEMTKRQYAKATGADFDRILRDQRYKEQHRQFMTAFFQHQVKQNPRLPEEHFLEVVASAANVDVLIITGMRDEAPVATFSPLIPDSQLLEVRVEASETTRWTRKGHPNRNDNHALSEDFTTAEKNASSCPDLTFHNNIAGHEPAENFAQTHLLPFLHPDLQTLQAMIPTIRDFPHPDFEFQHVLNIAQHPAGLSLCTSLLQTHFPGNWNQVDAILSCEAGAFLFAAPLSIQVGVKLALVRRVGKLPPPTLSVRRSASYISSLTSSKPEDIALEIQQDVLHNGASVVVVDDVLASGRTLCAILRLVSEIGVDEEKVRVLVVVELPVHRGRQFLRQAGFGKVLVRSLLVVGSA